MDGTTVSDNAVTMISTSTEGGVFGVGTGVNIQETGSGTIRDSVITENRITATGYTCCGDGRGGVDADGPLLLVDSLISGNQASTAVKSPVPGMAVGPSGAGIEMDAPVTIRGTTISGNRATVTGDASIAFILGGAVDNGVGQTVTLSDSVVTGNTATATTSSGTVFLEGAAIHNDTGTMTLRNTVVSDNEGTASGTNGAAQGGGVCNGSATLFGVGSLPSPPHLILTDSSVAHNSLAVSNQSITAQGGGVYNDTSQLATVSATNSFIAQNVADQRFDC